MGHDVVDYRGCAYPALGVAVRAKRMPVEKELRRLLPFVGVAASVGAALICAPSLRLRSTSVEYAQALVVELA